MFGHGPAGKPFGFWSVSFRGLRCHVLGTGSRSRRGLCWGWVMENNHKVRVAKAKKEASQRSSGICQYCGSRPVEEHHHWALAYPDDSVITGDDFTGLCKPCHYIATSLRRMIKAGYSYDQLYAELELAEGDRKTWEALMKWIRTSVSGTLRTLDSPQDSAVALVTNISHQQSELIRNEFRLLVARYTKRLIWVVLVAFAVSILYATFDVYTLVWWLLG